MNRIDVLVVGLGPAGASAAAAAAQAGARVLAIDRRAEPGLPVQCAEFVPALLGSDTAAVRAAAQQEIAAMDTFLGAEREHTPNFRGVMIDRAAFDAALVAEASRAGAEIRTGTRFCGIEGIDALIGDGERCPAAVVVGSDGPRSLVGRLAGLPNKEIVEARQVTVPLLHPHAATDIFLGPEIVGGYGWLFPRGDEANLGLGVAPPARAMLKPLLAALRDRLIAEGRIGSRQSRLTGGAIPVGGIAGLAGRIGEVPVLLAGDAAGLANPITGAGINAAVLSGRMAGAAAAGLAGGNTDAAEDYAEEVADLFDPSLRLAALRRRELMAHYDRGHEPGPDALRRSWIAFDDYWNREALTEGEPA